MQEIKNFRSCTENPMSTGFDICDSLSISYWFVLLFLPDETPDGSGFCGDGDDKKGLWGVDDVVLNNSPIILGKLLFACFSANANKLLFDSFDASARSEKLDISARNKFVFKISVLLSVCMRV